MREIVGTDGQFTTDEITDQLRSILVSQATDAIAESKIAILDLAANYNELGEAIAEKGHCGVRRIRPGGLQASGRERVASGGSRAGAGQAQQHECLGQHAAVSAVSGGKCNGGRSGESGWCRWHDGRGARCRNGDRHGAGNGWHHGTSRRSSPPSSATTAAADRVWFAAINGAQVGPLDAAGIQQQLAAGQISPATLLWKNGMAAWTPGQQIPELAALFAAPPPIPGAPPPIPTKRLAYGLATAGLRLNLLRDIDRADTFRSCDHSVRIIWAAHGD